MKPAMPALPVPAGYRQARAGFTLIELLVTIVVASILLGLAVPAFRSFMQNDQQWVQQQNLLLSLNTARSEAIKNDTTMNFPAPAAAQGGAQICSSTNGVTCTNTPWEQGWIVLGVDPANPGNPAKPLQVVGALPPGTTLTEVGGNLAVTFLSNGAVVAPVAFRMCDIRGPTFARYLQVTAMGRVLASSTPGMDLTNTPIAACP
jgi:type IV fimbrial biogenesis protein FimT